MKLELQHVSLTIYICIYSLPSVMIGTLANRSRKVRFEGNSCQGTSRHPSAFARNSPTYESGTLMIIRTLYAGNYRLRPSGSSTKLNGLSELHRHNLIYTWSLLRNIRD